MKIAAVLLLGLISITNAQAAMGGISSGTNPQPPKEQEQKDGYGWTGTCQGTDGLVVQVNPWDDDAQVIVQKNDKTIYTAIVIVSTFDAHANLISFQDGKRMNLDVRRSDTLPRGQGDLTLRGKRYSLMCDLYSVEDNNK